LELATRVALLEQRTEAIAEQLDELEEERLSLRQRVHVLEGTRAAESAAAAAVSALKADRHAVQAGHLTRINAIAATGAVLVAIVSIVLHYV
jgi:hypothetical protein